MFDLDDTLYPERDFVKSGFSAVGKHVAEKTGCDDFENTCLALFEKGYTSRIFDRALDMTGLGSDAGPVSHLVEIYRNHSPQIRLSADAEGWLAKQRIDVGLGIITDGLSHTQHRKIKALGLDRLVDKAICTGDWSEAFYKPHPRSFMEIEIHFGVTSERLTYVADNPAKDFLTPRRRGWRTIQINRPGRIHSPIAPGPDYAANMAIDSLDGLDATLASYWERAQCDSNRSMVG